ncbi:hypothetical protein, partial [Prevotella sp. HMSC073D09]|uniref:hypothetical protein n=1 Tax=Prevotella sp. HMSC073D09 TaxID=1739459 RepID=UPI001AF029A5
PKRTAFCGILHSILHQNALHFTANSPKNGVNAGFGEYIFILPACTTPPLLHQNQPSRESIFCGKIGGWWSERALRMLNFSLKTRQKK